jgi:hypothetical protein
MSRKSQDRAPLQIRGPGRKESVSLFRSTQDPKLSLQELVLYRLAGTTPYRYGEPVELTRARDNVDSWCDYAELQLRHGMPIIPPAPVVIAMQLRGWTVCD